MAKNDNERRYWVEIPSGFPDDPRHRLIRSQEYGRSALLLYLELLAMSAKTEGNVLHEDGTPFSIEEIGILFNIPQDEIYPTIDLLKKYSLLGMEQDETLVLPMSSNFVRSETLRAERLRKYRQLSSGRVHAGSNEPKRTRNEPDAGSNEPRRTRSQKTDDFAHSHNANIPQVEAVLLEKNAASVSGSNEPERTQPSKNALSDESGDKKATEKKGEKKKSPCTPYKEKGEEKGKKKSEDLSLPALPQTPKGSRDENSDDSDSDGDASSSLTELPNPNLPDRAFMVLQARQRGIPIDFIDRFLAAMRETDYRFSFADGSVHRVGRHNFGTLLQAAWYDESRAARQAQKVASFIPPTQEEVVAYFKKQGFRRDGVEFWRYYQSIGWKRGTSPITNWKLVATSWENKEDFRGSHGASGMTRKGTRNGTTRRETRRGDPNSRNPEHTCYSDILAAKGLA